MKNAHHCAIELCQRASSRFTVPLWTMMLLWPLNPVRDILNASHLFCVSRSCLVNRLPAIWIHICRSVCSSGSQLFCCGWPVQRGNYTLLPIPTLQLVVSLTPCVLFYLWSWRSCETEVGWRSEVQIRRVLLFPSWLAHQLWPFIPLPVQQICWVGCEVNTKANCWLLELRLNWPGRIREGVNTLTTHCREPLPISDGFEPSDAKLIPAHLRYFAPEW